MFDVCVFGGCSLDQIFYQKVDGSYPKNPDVLAPGGKASNQAVASCKAGAKTAIITKLGNDEIGEKILDNLKFIGVDTSCVELVNGLENDYSNIYINIKDKDNSIERHTGATESFTIDMVEKYKDTLLNSKIIVCQLKIPKEVTIALINFCHENNKLLVLTPCRPEKLSITDKENLALVDKISIITCNRTECETIFGTKDYEACVTKYPRKLIVTLGADGLMYHNGKSIVKLPAIPCDVVDTVGAGDTLNGNLCASLTQGVGFEYAVRRSMYASCMKIGVQTAQAGMPYKEDLDIFISNLRNKKFEYSVELNFILERVKKAFDLYGSMNYSIKSKSDNTLVTDVDVAIDTYLINEIKNKFPNDFLLTEEHYAKGVLMDRTWVIDPLDGTAHFVRSDGEWGIQLAFYDKNEIKFSIIYLPVKNELYYSAKNVGTFRNNDKLFGRLEKPLNQSIVEFAGTLHKSFEIKKECYSKMLKEQKVVVNDVSYINSSCISYTNLIMGRSDALISSTTKPWDIMPGEFMCKQLGYEIIFLDQDKKVKLITNNKAIKDLILEN